LHDRSDQLANCHVDIQSAFNSGQQTKGLYSSTEKVDQKLTGWKRPSTATAIVGTHPVYDHSAQRASERRCFPPFDPLTPPQVGTKATLRRCASQPVQAYTYGYRTYLRSTGQAT
jgi:hypothetical protein